MAEGTREIPAEASSSGLDMIRTASKERLGKTKSEKTHEIIEAYLSRHRSSQRLDIGRRAGAGANPDLDYLAFIAKPNDHLTGARQHECSINTTRC